MARIRPYHIIAARVRLAILRDLGKPVPETLEKLAALNPADFRLPRG